MKIVRQNVAINFFVFMADINSELWDIKSKNSEFISHKTNLQLSLYLAIMNCEIKCRNDLF